MARSRIIQEVGGNNPARLLPLKDLYFDDTYQRGVRSKHRQIVNDFDQDALGMLIVGERDDGKLHVVDGLQRVTALHTLGRTHAWGVVFRSRGPEHEAQVFKKINGGRTNLSSAESFKALVRANDERALAVKRVVESCGYTILLDGNRERSARELVCAGTLLSLVPRGLDGIRFALNTAKECWPCDKDGTDYMFLQGLVYFHRRNKGVVDTDSLYPKLRRENPRRIMLDVGRLITSGYKAHKIADALEMIYRGKS